MEPRVVTDKAGRRLELRRIGVLETLRLYKALGPALAENDSYVALASVACSVSMIDGVPVLFPNNEAAVEALVERLGEDGVAAVMDAAAVRPAPEMVAEAGN